MKMDRAMNYHLKRLWSHFKNTSNKHEDAKLYKLSQNIYTSKNNLIHAHF